MAAAPPRQLHDGGARRAALVTLGCALWGIKQGLPYSYNVDEETHFVPRAIAFFSHDLNPQYFLNPPAYSYLLHVVFAVWFGGADAVARAYAAHPAEVFVVARVVAAVLGTVAAVLAPTWPARASSTAPSACSRRRSSAVAFLPVFYSHLALNDVPTLAPVALALYGERPACCGAAGGATTCSPGVGRRAGLGDEVHRRRSSLLLPAGRGLRLRPAAERSAAAGAWSGAAGGLARVPDRQPVRAARLLGLWPGLRHQAGGEPGRQARDHARAAGPPTTCGRSPGAWAGRPRWRRSAGLCCCWSVAGALALVLVPAPIAFILFMGDQQRFFGRWLMPIFPIVALLAAYGAVELVRWLAPAGRVAPAAGRRAARRRSLLLPRAWSRSCTTTRCSRARTPAT